MFVLPLIIVVSSFFLILWAADLYFTLKATKKGGLSLEINPIMRWLLGAKKQYLIAFKFVEAGIFFSLLYFVSITDGQRAVYALLTAIIVYSVIVAQGAIVFLKAGGNPSAVGVLVVIGCLFAVISVFLSYNSYTNTIELAKGLQACGSKYSDLYVRCTGTNASVITRTIPDIGLNLTIPR